MNEILVTDLAVGETCLFQLSHWAPANLHLVRIKYVGERYVVMQNLERDVEYCATHDVYDNMIEGREPKFYVSEEL